MLLKLVKLLTLLTFLALCFATAYGLATGSHPLLWICSSLLAAASGSFVWFDIQNLFNK